MSSTGLGITPTLVADQVFDTLQRAIFTGELAAGTPLRVRDLAEKVGTSVMPVREAIRRLEEAGLATRTPHKGAIVRAFTVSELIHIYDVRTVLEVEAARRGVENITEEGVHRMAAACRDMLHAVADGRLVEALEHDEATLRVLYEAGGNPVLMSVIDTLWMQCRPYKVLGANEAQNNADPTLWTHQPLLTEAARTGDVETAVSLTEKSLVSARRRLERRLIAQTEGN